MTAFFQADDFTLVTAARIESITFRDLDYVGVFDGTVLWRIYSNGADNGPGTLLYTGTSPSSHLPTGFVDGQAIEYVNTFAVSPPVSLPPGTYWLALHNGPLSNSFNQRIYWEKADGAAPRPSRLDFGPLFLGVWWSNSAPNSPTAELMFQLNGIPAPRATAMTRLLGRPRFSFTTVANQYYRVEYKNSLADTSWTVLQGGEMVYGTGAPVEVPDPDPNIATVRRRFYRAVLL